MFGVAFALPRDLVNDRSARIVIEGVVNIAITVVREPWKAVAVVCVCLFTC